MRAFAAAVLAGLALAACGPGADEEPRPGAPPPPAETLYEANATVLEAPGERPMLCVGAVAESLPPQCGDVPIEGWSWDAVEGEESAAGTTWGDYRVVGRFDGETFSLVEAGPPAPEPEPDDIGEQDGFEPPCEEPEGGWAAPDPAAAFDEQIGAAEGYATRQPDYVRSWVYNLLDPRELEEREPEGDLPVVYVAIFRANADEHEARLRELWRGPLCVVERDVPSRAEAERIRGEAEALVEELGLQILWSYEGELGEAAAIAVVADPGGGGRAALDERFGAGVVRLEPALRPVGR